MIYNLTGARFAPVSCTAEGSNPLGWSLRRFLDAVCLMSSRLQRSVRELRARDQNSNFTANCATRGSSAVVIVPKFAAPATAVRRAEVRRCSDRLKISARSSIARSRDQSARAASARDRRRGTTARVTGLRDAEPIVNTGATANAAVLNHCVGRPLVGGQRRIADEIRPLHAEAGERVEIRRLRHRDRHAGLQRDRAPSPSSRWRSRRARRAADARGPRRSADPRRPTTRTRAACRRSSSRARARG